MRVVGLDIGGANLKAADADGRAIVRAFPVWRNPEGLSSAISEILKSYASVDLLAVTMTAELVDCFRTKHDGVCQILNAVEQSAGTTPVHVWQTGAEFVSPAVAREISAFVAAANWHALATWVGRLAPEGEALLVDIGSTTTDIIPLSQGIPVPTGFTDRERLLSGELVYSGVRRTPICALVQSVPFRGAECPVAAELFATTLDAYLMLGDIPEDSTDRETANGRPATKVEALHRLARLICSDATEFTVDDAECAARHVGKEQQVQLIRAIDRVLDRMAGSCCRALISGAGSFLAYRALSNAPRLKNVPVILLNEVFEHSVSDAACAFAVARLAVERLAT